MRKILLFGANGQVGWRVQQACAQREIACVAVAREAADLSTMTRETVRALIDRYAPTHIINAAAYTAVDMAESERDVAFAVNAQAPTIIAEVARERNISVMHFSTDYVLDGVHGAPYAEDAPTRPLSVYGGSKLSGEQAVLAAGGTVFRLQWVYDMRGANFFLRMHEIMAQRERVRIIADQWGAPTFAKHVANAVLDALEVPSGLYHLTSSGATSWHGFTCAIHAAMRQPMTNEIIAISSAEYPLAATRPLDTRLSTAKLAALGMTLPHWQAGVREAMEELHATA
jgi:dTDP-4-dehydrorhamnose reductase